MDYSWSNLDRALTAIMCCRLVIALALAAACSAQYKGHPETAAILSDSRYLGGDGAFGSAYTQEDGVQFKEESDAEGNRKGSYSYVDPTGQRRTVTYTAGKNGFQAFGDHLPVPPPAPPTPAPVPPQPQYQPQYRPQAQPQQQQYYQPQPQYSAHTPAPPQPRYQPAYTPPPQYDDGQYREEYDNPNYQSPNSPQAPTPSPQYSYSFGATPAPLAYAAAGISPPQFPLAAAPQQLPQSSAHRFLPPGKFNLNRTPDGFSYTFSKS